jgi:tetratricopeptide (TPR) repeat protein
MSKVENRKRIKRLGALVLATSVAACTGDDVGQNVGQERDLAIAQPASTEPVTTTGEVSKPNYTNVSYSDAEAVFRKGRYQDAMEMFAGYVITHPDNGSGHYLLGISAWKSGDHGRAEEALLRAVELDSTSVKARTNLARVLLEQGRPADALPHVQKAAELKPESHEVWRVLGNTQGQLGMNEEALESYRQALIRNDRDVWSMNNFGLILIQQGRYEEALQPLARAVELVPLSAVFQNNLGSALEKCAYLESARRAFAAAVEADNGYVKAKTSLERVQVRLGDTEGETADLSAFAQSFVEEIQRWKIKG